MTKERSAQTLVEVAKREGAPLGNLQALCDWVRHYYFKNDIPPVQAIVSKRLKTTLASINWMSKDLVIKFREDALSDPAVLIDTITHEMIHAWQGAQYRATGDAWYLDRELSLGDKKRHLKGRPFSKGHGAAFYMKVNELSEEFPELSGITTYHSMLDEPLYSDHEKDLIVVTHGANQATSFFYSADSLDDVKKSAFIDSLTSRRMGSFRKVEFLKTKHLGASTAFMRLKKDGTYSEHKKIYAYSKEAPLVRAILQDKSTRLDEAWSKEQAIDKIHEYRQCHADNNVSAEIMIIQYTGNKGEEPLHLAVRAKEKIRPADAVYLVQSLKVTGYSKAEVTLLKTSSLRLFRVETLRADGRVKTRGNAMQKLFKSEMFCNRIISDPDTRIIAQGDYRALMAPMQDLDWWKANRERFEVKISAQDNTHAWNETQKIAAKTSLNEVSKEGGVGDEHPQSKTKTKSKQFEQESFDF